jgi:hypothetical protein
MFESVVDKTWLINEPFPVVAPIDTLMVGVASQMNVVPGTESGADEIFSVANCPLQMV